MMDDPRMTLLEKAGNALYHWLMNSPSDTMTKAMGELGDAVQESEALRPINKVFAVNGYCSFKTRSDTKDMQLVNVWLLVSEDGEPYTLLETRTLTKTPQNYVFDGIIRRGEGYYYITRSYTIKFSDWPLLLRAFLEIKEVADPILAAFNKKEEEK